MRVAMLAPIHWCTPPKDYGPWELVASLITEGLVRKGVDVTLFASKGSKTAGKLHTTFDPVGEGRTQAAKVLEVLHIAEVFEHAKDFDIIHSHYDWQPLSYSRLVSTPVITTVHGFSSEAILPAYKRYNDTVSYVSISNSDRHPDLTYAATVYHGINLKQFTLQTEPGEYLLFFGRISQDKGTREAIEVSLSTKIPLIIAGNTPEEDYFKKEVEPFIDGRHITYVGSAGPIERNRLLGGARALLHLINFDEPFGLSVVEAMACGTPVVAINRGSMPEVIADTSTGFLVRSVNEATRAIDRIDTIDRSACRQHVEQRFSVDRMAADYLDVYRQIVSETR